MMKKKIIQAMTVDLSLRFFLGMYNQLSDDYEVVYVGSKTNEGEAYVLPKGARFIDLYMERHISLWQDLKSLINLIRLFHKEKPYMVHSITPKAGLLCMMAARVCGVPIRVHTFTGLIWPTAVGLKKKILMLTDRITCFCATHIIPEGEGVRNDLLDNGITHKPIKVLGYGNLSGIDMVRFSRRPEVVAKADELYDKNCFTFLFVGRIVGDKGINELIEAFTRLQSKYKNVRLWLIGWFEDNLNPISDTTRRIIKENDSIVALYEKFDDELLAYYAASDCYVFPSYREGFPNTVLEAGALGLPSIVTDINGSREIITDKRNYDPNAISSPDNDRLSDETMKIHDNGIVVPSKNVDDLFRAMELMYNNEALRKKMASNARDMIESRFERKFVNSCLLDFYKTLL